MLRGIGLALTMALLICCAGCAEQGQQGVNGNSNTRTASATPAATGTPAAATTTPAASPAVATSSPSPSAPTTATVKNIPGNKWQDEASGSAVTTIKVGGTVTWNITGGMPHSLKRDGGTDANGCGNLDDQFDTGNLSGGQSVTRTFNTAGTFGYHCGVHGGTPNCKTPPGSGMSGVIKVVP